MAAIREMLARGLSIDQALVAAEIMEDTEVTKLEKRRVSDAARQAAKRERDEGMSRDSRYPSTVTVTVPSRAGARAEPVINNSSSPTEKNKEEKRKSPPSAGTRSKTLCPEDFTPTVQHEELRTELALPLPAFFEARDTMVAWSRGNGERRLDWNAVFANWLRRDAVKARGSPQAPKAGNGTGFNGKATLGDINRWAKEAIAARDANGQKPTIELLAGPGGRPGNGTGGHKDAHGLSRQAERPDGADGDLLRGLGPPGSGPH